MKVIAKVLTEKVEASLTLSVSKAKTFVDCTGKYKFCYIDKLPRIDQDFHIFGKFLHQILENFHGSIIKDPSLKETWQDYLNGPAWDNAYEEYQELITGIQYKDAKKMIKEYQELLEEDGLPNATAVEEPFYILLYDADEPDFTVLLNGFIDRKQIDKDGLLHVIDYKTTKDPKYLKDFFQLITYCFALMLKDEKIERARASFVLLRHNFDYLTKEFTRKEAYEVAEKFMKYAKSIRDEKLWRPNPQFLCKYCDYVDHCGQGKDYLIKKGIIDKPKIITGIVNW
jgi:RecB family exonuclease